MEMEITLPDEVPVMTLPNMTFFPQALLPLHIFEPRYRNMLRDVLATNRLFAVTGLNPKLADQAGQFEPPHRIASVGIVRVATSKGPPLPAGILPPMPPVETVQQPRRRWWQRKKEETT